jgi:hypothetical protein
MLLAALPAPTLGLVTVKLAAGAIMYEVGDEIDRIYFPNSRIASLQKVMMTAAPSTRPLLGATASWARWPLMLSAGPQRGVSSTITAFTISALGLARVDNGRLRAREEAPILRPRLPTRLVCAAY